MAADKSDLVARNVRRFRHECGYSLSELARHADLAKQTLSSIEAGQANPTVLTLTEIAAGLILTGTFASLMLAGNSTLTQMGFAIAFGIAIAAFVMALFFTPALTALIRHAAWWPGHGDTAQRPTAVGDDNQQTFARSGPPMNRTDREEQPRSRSG